MGRLLTAVTFLLYLNSYSQDIAKIDRDKGLDQFLFDAPITDWEENVKEILRISYGQSYYLYTGPAPDIKYNLKIHSVHVGFFKGRLNYADYYFKGLDDLMFDALKSMVSEDYGKPEVYESIDDKSILEAYRWPGERGFLELVRYSGETADWDDRHMTKLSAKKKLED